MSVIWSGITNVNINRNIHSFAIAVIKASWNITSCRHIYINIPVLHHSSKYCKACVCVHFLFSDLSPYSTIKGVLYFSLCKTSLVITLWVKSFLLLCSIHTFVCTFVLCTCICTCAHNHPSVHLCYTPGFIS